MNKTFRIIVAVSLSSLGLALMMAGVRAGGVLFWNSMGAPISTAPYGQSYPKAVSDGSGGAIIVWQDYRSGTFNDIYAQRVNSSGQVQWMVNGVAVSTAANDQQYPQIASDGQGGAIIVWQDKRNGVDYDIFAQRISANGVPLWNTNGVTICAALNDQDYPTIVSNEQGGAIITWEDGRRGTQAYQYDIYAQRVSANGIALWMTNGISLSLSVSPIDDSPVILDDGQSGAIVAWNHSVGNGYILAQRVLSDGVALWQPGGITVSLNWGYYPTMVSDGSSGAILAWEGTHIYSQRVLSDGTPYWGSNGLTFGSGYAFNPSLVRDGSGGAFIAWQQGPNLSYSNIFAQHILSNSAQSWASSGVTVSTIPVYQQVPRMVSDGYGGVVIVWEDTASATNDYMNYSIWAQRVDWTGATQWITDGVTVITGTNSPLSDLVSDMGHGGIAVWYDQRNSDTTGTDVYAQRVADFTVRSTVYLPLILRQ